ncbi:hypothetical protein DET61_1384 [Marinobacter nauticus]|uniref:Uncharacterized protein n=1 Tax=Marinobacter nauticus TaxID=2743 RepID=A0A368X1Q3_MARNT|nr:hypothetical protein [Marinobacter nauticus]RCW61942.1 hypothetical protein DET61_1384 [Marinobacter nauticus]
MTIEPKDELELTQKIITAQEELCFKIFSWALGLITALTIGAAHKSVVINNWLYLASGLFIVFTLFMVAKRHWLTMRKAVIRSSEIENEVKNSAYSCYKINEALKKNYEGATHLSFRFYGPYLMLSGIVLGSFIYEYMK